MVLMLLTSQTDENPTDHRNIRSRGRFIRGCVTCPHVLCSYSFSIKKNFPNFVVKTKIMFFSQTLTLSCSANERTEMKLKIYLSEALMCSEFGMLITDVERERVKRQDTI